MWGAEEEGTSSLPERAQEGRLCNRQKPGLVETGVLVRGDAAASHDARPFSPSAGYLCALD